VFNRLGTLGQDKISRISDKLLCCKCSGVKSSSTWNQRFIPAQNRKSSLIMAGSDSWLQLNIFNAGSRDLLVV
jgi:hypothetical protein